VLAFGVCTVPLPLVSFEGLTAHTGAGEFGQRKVYRWVRPSGLFFALVLLPDGREAAVERECSSGLGAVAFTGGGIFL